MKAMVIHSDGHMRNKGEKQIVWEWLDRGSKLTLILRNPKYYQHLLVKGGNYIGKVINEVLAEVWFTWSHPVIISLVVAWTIGIRILDSWSNHYIVSLLCGIKAIYSNGDLSCLWPDSKTKTILYPGGWDELEICAPIKDLEDARLLISVLVC